MSYQQNPDRVTPPVVSGGGVGLVLAVLVRSLIDRYADPADRELWWNVFQAALFLLPLAGAALGARLKARNDVTPVTPGDAPRDQEGHRLWPLGAMPHDESTGYLPTRLAGPAERPRRQPPPTDFP